jgi:hypothetical protein
MRVEEDYFFLSLFLSLSLVKEEEIYMKMMTTRRETEREVFSSHEHKQKQTERGFSSSFFLTTPNYQYSTVTNFE